MDDPNRTKAFALFRHSEKDRRWESPSRPNPLSERERFPSDGDLFSLMDGTPISKGETDLCGEPASFSPSKNAGSLRCEA